MSSHNLKINHNMLIGHIGVLCIIWQMVRKCVRARARAHINKRNAYNDGRRKSNAKFHLDQKPLSFSFQIQIVHDRNIGASAFLSI